MPESLKSEVAAGKFRQWSTPVVWMGAIPTAWCRYSLVLNKPLLKLQIGQPCLHFPSKPRETSRAAVISSYRKSVKDPSLPMFTQQVGKSCSWKLPECQASVLLASGCSWVLTSALKSFRSCFVIWLWPKYHCCKSKIGSTLLTAVQPDSFLACPLQWSSWPEGRGRAGFPPT